MPNTSFSQIHIPWNKGKTGYKMPPASEERKKKVRQTLLGHSVSLETRDKMRKFGLKNARRGIECNFWKGGITPVNQLIRTSSKFRQWREAVFERDDYTCQICGIRNNKGLGKTVKLNADHIKPFALYSDLRFNINNGRTLCEDCHRNTPTFGCNMIAFLRGYKYA